MRKFLDSNLKEIVIWRVKMKICLLCTNWKLHIIN